MYLLKTYYSIISQAACHVTSDCSEEQMEENTRLFFQQEEKCKEVEENTDEMEAKEEEEEVEADVGEEKELREKESWEKKEDKEELKHMNKRVNDYGYENEKDHGYDNE